jgi:hypothetical protein
VCGKRVLRRIAKHKKFKTSEQRENYVLNNFNIRTPILVLLLLFEYDESWGAGNTNKNFGGTKRTQRTWAVQGFK